MAQVDVITGFLGAGKTTFLRRYTRWLKEQGQSFCIIENEFGKAGVDGALLAQTGALIKEISGGCVCCTLKVTLHDLLLEMSSKVDRILVEPSGLFCGDDFCDIMESPAIKECAHMGMWVGIVDPCCVDFLNETDLEVMKSELVFAGSVLLSKAQICSSEELMRAKKLISSLLERPEPYLSDENWDAVDEDQWFSVLQKAGMVYRKHLRKRFDHGTMFQSITLTSQQCFELGVLQDTLKKLFHCGQVLRIKGTLKDNSNGVFHVNCTPGCINIESDQNSLQPMLNVIGRDLDRKSMNTLLK